ncbi:MAG TPA: hypothetical protein QF468_12405 [Nitrospinota bacterium]|nr:hypothetical protein [Nitrospinota bacterium]
MSFQDTIIAGLIVAVVGWIITTKLADGIPKLSDVIHKRIAKITLDFSKGFPSEGMELWVRFIREGKDNPNRVENEKPKIKDKKVKLITGEDVGIVKFLYNKRIGFQYKCYVDFENGLHEKVKRLLTDNNYKQISRDGENLNRLWFLIPDKPTCKTSGGYIDNYFHSGRK